MANKTFGIYKKSFACLCEIISLMKKDLSAGYTSSSQRGLITSALEYIAENYITKKISVKELAEFCSISEFYMRKLFLPTVGISPMSYINQLRLERSRYLLISGEYTVSSEAKECGFTDECYFNREFKKAYGFPQKNWRIRHNKTVRR